MGSGRQRLSGCAGACERERNGPGGLAGPVLMLGQIGGAWPFSFVLLLFFFCFDFLNWFSNEFKLFLNSNLSGVFAVCNSLKSRHKTMWLLCRGLVIFGETN